MLVFYLLPAKGLKNEKITHGIPRKIVPCEIRRRASLLASYLRHLSHKRVIVGVMLYHRIGHGVPQMSGLEQTQRQLRRADIILAEQARDIYSGRGDIMIASSLAQVYLENAPALVSLVKFYIKV